MSALLRDTLKRNYYNSYVTFISAFCVFTQKRLFLCVSPSYQCIGLSAIMYKVMRLDFEQ